MSTSKWRLVEDKESTKFYKECSELHRHSTTLVTVLRCVLLKLHEAQANKLSSGVHSKDDDVELQINKHKSGIIVTLRSISCNIREPTLVLFLAVDPISHRTWLTSDRKYSLKNSRPMDWNGRGHLTTGVYLGTPLSVERLGPTMGNNHNSPQVSLPHHRRTLGRSDHQLLSVDDPDPIGYLGNPRHILDPGEGRVGPSKHNDQYRSDLEYAVELMQVAVPSFLDLASRRLPVEMKTQEKTRRTAPQPEVSTPARRTEVWSVVCGSKVGHWREIVWQDRITLLYLCHQVVTDILRCCNNIAEQNHNHRTLENVFRLSNLYNDALALGSKDNQSVSTWCKNTCPILLYPLRKLSITKILQASVSPVQSGGMLSESGQQPAGELFPDANNRSRSDIHRRSKQPGALRQLQALVRHMTPPNATVLPPVNKVTPEGNKLAILPGLDVSGIDRLVAQEERHVATLLCVTARSTPHFLGRSGVKTSRNSGKQKASRQVKDRVVQFYQQVLWGEVGSFMEHVVLWWGSLPMGTMPQEYCREFRNWLHNITVNGGVPQLVVPAVQSLIDGLVCHVSSTSWDQLFRRTMVFGHSRQNNNSGLLGPSQGTVTGQLFCGLLQSLVTLSNSCEVTTEWMSAPPIEDLPLVEQIPVLHRLDHSVHTARLWAANRARQLANSWTVDVFFLVSHADINSCLEQLAQLQLADHKDLSSVRSEHMMVCAKMRAKLVSEVRENIAKLKKLSDENIVMLAAVCRTISLANLSMCFPGPQYWKQNLDPPKCASPYVEKYLDRVLRPVLLAVVPLPVAVQKTVGGMVIRIMCEAWLDHIYSNNVKFTEWGAVQLLNDFGTVPSWLSERVTLSPEVLNSLLRHEVLRRCEGVGRLLLRRPGEHITMVTAPTRTRGTSDSRAGSPQSAGLDTMPAEMFVPNQEQWLELRAPKQRALCSYSLCCSS
uniref:Coiled-coil protein 142 C-terminal domain-containing protein n=1 Tax=Timema cristinae TaxID=61476 RepID=A0A7R9D9D0_TIMCR|nr:unnamed protein product [Timema cristinae]